MKSCTRLVAIVGCSLAYSLTVSVGDDDGTKPMLGTNQGAVANVPQDPAERENAGRELFQKEVRSVLVHQCLDCHGGKSVKGDFDLSTREKLVESGSIEVPEKDGSVPVEGLSTGSYLMELIDHRSDPKMPFKKPKMSAKEIDLIRRWIDLGAPYDKPLVEASAGPPAEMQVTEENRQFWSFRPLSEPTPPVSRQSGKGRTAIDQFILAKQDEQGLTMNSEADRRVLIRRAYFDLIGLPPTPEEVDQFLSDADPQAYELMIDRLLASPHYGERWARHWMDVARFAESHGYEQDYDRPHAYHYRDFLIKAFNADMPFDQFVRWQLAGDELAPNDPLAMTATGFLGAGVFPTQLTETEFESARYDELDDMVTTTGVAFLGLSVGCARCHDHKFDPIPTKDYYRLASTFTTTIRSEIDLDLDLEGNLEKREAFAARKAELEANLAKYEQERLPMELATFLKSYDPAMLPGAGDWSLLDGTPVSSAGTKFVKQEDGSWLATGDVAAKEVITFEGLALSPSLRAIRLETLTDYSLPSHGPGRAPNGNFALGDFKVTASPLNQNEKLPPQVIKFSEARATMQQNNTSLSVAASIDDDPISGWAVDGGISKNQAAVFDFTESLVLDGGARLTVTLTLNHPNTKHSIGRMRLSVASKEKLEATIGNLGPDPAIRQALTTLKSNPDDAAARLIASNWYKTQSPQWREAKLQLDAHIAKGDEVKLTKAMVSSEGFPHMSHHADGRGFPHFYPETHFLTRGDVHKKGEVAPAGFLQVLMNSDGPGSTVAEFEVPKPADWQRTSYRRATLANWMTDHERGAGHLVARVIVNRLWQHHFGRGIVSSVSDFGFSGERPTHPELLDWLAYDLVANGWQLKRLHKLMMTSAVYMQNGDFDEQRAAIDRENHFFWRRAPQRLEGEAIRDAMLAVSGQLDPRMYGPGTLDANMKRRSVYFFIKRSQLIPMMMLFDWPEHLVSIGQRSNTTIAPQALMFMNSTLGRSAADALSKRLRDLDDTAAITQAYRLIVSRSPNAQELEMAGRFLKQQSSENSSNRTAAIHLARTDLFQMLLATNEFSYIE